MAKSRKQKSGKSHKQKSPACGLPCENLSAIEHRFHLAFLLSDNRTQSYLAASQREVTVQSAGVLGAKMFKRVRVKAAVAYHREEESKRYQMQKDEAIEILSRRAKLSDLGNFVEVVERKGLVDGEVIESEDVRLILPWDRSKTLGLSSIEKRPDGLIKVTVPGPEVALRELAKIQGWNAPTKLEVTADPKKIAAMLDDDF